MKFEKPTKKISSSHFDFSVITNVANSVSQNSIGKMTSVNKWCDLLNMKLTHRQAPEGGKKKENSKL
jgi:hypothetical protein